MKARLYLLEGTYPSKVIIKNNLITKEYTYQNSQEFINDINNLFEINNNHDTTVILVLDPSICRNIAMDNGFGKFQLAGYNNLNNYDNIRFYHYDEKNDLEIFEDIYQKDIQSSDNKLLNLALQKDVNLELVKKGESLIKEIKCEILEIDENKELVEYIEKDLLTDKKLISIVNKYDKINTINNLKASIYAIYQICNNHNDIKEIIRNWILSTEPIIKNNDYTTLTSKFESIAKVCDNICNDRTYLTFEEIEETIKDKFNYLMIMNIDLLEEYKYQITSIDFKEKKVYFKPYYY